MPAVLSSVVGFSRMGPQRELKKRVEQFWKDSEQQGASPALTAAFEQDVEQLQVQRWTALKESGLQLIPSGDHSLYDQVLDAAFLFNAIPQRYRALEQGTPGVRTYFAMARGLQEKGVDVAALPMKKWFDTNYHFIVPEIAPDQQFSITTNKPLNDFLLAKRQLGLTTKPVLVGPITFLHFAHELGTDISGRKEHLKLLPALLPQYVAVVRALVEAGAQFIQVDEPVFALSLPEASRAAYHQAFKQAAEALQQAAGAGAHVIFATYFGGIVGTGNAQIVKDLPAGAGIHVDLVRAPEQLPAVLGVLPAQALISLGLVDGRNVWLTPLQKAADVAAGVVKQLGAGRVHVATSCSLLHVPYSTKGEHVRVSGSEELGAKVLPWLSFGLEKISHVVAIANSVNGVNGAQVAAFIRENTALLDDHAVSPLIHNADVAKRVAKLHADGVEHYFRQTPHAKRTVEQHKRLQLPLIPTTTIGSFPQSAEVRSTRARFKAGRITQQEYDAFINAETERCIRIQEQIGLDVLVHGEFERNDMVEYFADFIRGYLVTSNGWVQSYGSRCVKPPVLYGDVHRSGPMTVAMSKYAQSLTSRPMKGMLTGPTTILKWSFVRNDQPLKDTVFQLALAIRDEVQDLDQAGIKAIQVDEPGFREGLPLDANEHQQYLKNTVEAFKISTGSATDATAVHTHMCYSDFEDIFTHIAELDADVIFIECSRSELSLLSCFDRFGYPLEVGPGLYDIHSPRVPTHEELKARLEQMIKYIPVERIWANPDCGLKTRAWPETKAALQVLVDVAKEVRQSLGGKK